jgi:TatD DNase family protein
LLHRRAGAGDEGDRTGAVDFVHGHPTFKKSESLRALAAELPADRIMVETDAPYLAPGKFRGKRNEPSYVVEVAKVLAETRGVSLEEISRQTTENFFRLFAKVPA